MRENISPEVTPEKIYPFLKKADHDQLETLYRLAHHLIRAKAPVAQLVPLTDFMELLKEGTNRQLLLIIQAAYHIIHKERLSCAFYDTASELS